MYLTRVVRATAACLIFSVNLAGQGVECSMEDHFFVNIVRYNVTAAVEACRAMGYDGLAIASSPEEFNYIVKATEKGRHAEMKENARSRFMKLSMVKELNLSQERHKNQLNIHWRCGMHSERHFLEKVIKPDLFIAPLVKHIGKD
ncbi:hypothetical protein PoB_007051700 [Plakobranchus ocellatus]|uniref:Uncharacterized protein n=1 Tax=Plakobranchus ocellatus TaxID=259542 RepID=A0AAV4DIC9_9GAST|nr:hypothetical protein PoB_007051700 [Plakobranchus ocellatus]